MIEAFDILDEENEMGQPKTFSGFFNKEKRKNAGNKRPKKRIKNLDASNDNGLIDSSPKRAKKERLKVTKVEAEKLKFKNVQRYLPDISEESIKILLPEEEKELGMITFEYPNLIDEAVLKLKELSETLDNAADKLSFKELTELKIEIQNAKVKVSQLQQELDEATNKLVMSSLHIIIKIAKKYINNRLPQLITLHDAIAEGYLGLKYAITKFNPQLARLQSYAEIWINTYIKTMVQKSEKNIPLYVQRQINLMYKTKDLLESLLERPPTYAEIAVQMNEMQKMTKAITEKMNEPEIVQSSKNENDNETSNNAEEKLERKLEKKEKRAKIRFALEKSNQDLLKGEATAHLMVKLNRPPKELEIELEMKKIFRLKIEEKAAQDKSLETEKEKRKDKVHDNEEEETHEKKTAKEKKRTPFMTAFKIVQLYEREKLNYLLSTDKIVPTPERQAIFETLGDTLPYAIHANPYAKTQEVEILKVNLMKETVKELVDKVLKKNKTGERDTTILKLYYGLEGNEPMSYQKIALTLGLSRAWVRKISRDTLEELRKAATSNEYEKIRDLLADDEL